MGYIIMLTIFIIIIVSLESIIIENKRVIVRLNENIKELKEIAEDIFPGEYTKTYQDYYRFYEMSLNQGSSVKKINDYLLVYRTNNINVINNLKDKKNNNHLISLLCNYIDKDNTLTRYSDSLKDYVEAIILNTITNKVERHIVRKSLIKVIKSNEKLTEDIEQLKNQINNNKSRGTKCKITLMNKSDYLIYGTH
jgi:hypothetical protein